LRDEHIFFYYFLCVTKSQDGSWMFSSKFQDKVRKGKEATGDSAQGKQIDVFRFTKASKGD